MKSALAVTCLLALASRLSVLASGQPTAGERREALARQAANDNEADESSPAGLDSSGELFADGPDEEADEEQAQAQAQAQGQADLYGLEEPSRADSNIANAKIYSAPEDMATAAGHHHHHGHYVHGKLEMGAHTGKKGSFGWHDKHPVGGKGR